MRKDHFPPLRSGACLIVKGLNQNRLIATLVKDGVKLYSLNRISPREMRVKILCRDLNKTLETAEKLGFEMSVEKKTGLLAALKRSIVRLAVPVTLAALTAAYCFAYGFVWRIDVSGTERFDSHIVTDTLAALGVKAGAKKSDVDFKAAESALRKVDGIAEATVWMQGAALKVSVVENLDFVPRPEGGVRSIDSKYDAEITRVVVRSGTALVKAGNRVFAGKPLISGDVLGTDGNVIKEGYATGEVYGKVVFSESAAIALSGTRVTPTGRVKRSTVLSIWGIKIGKRSDNFEYAATETETEKLMFLPVRVTTLTAHELKCESYEMSKEEAVAEAEKTVRERLAERLVGDPLKEQLVIRELDGGVIEAELFVTVEMLIGAA